jgi:hypothetical protein
MNKSFFKISIISIILFVLMGTGPVWADDNKRNWDNGSVWTVSPVETKPGKFNAYINDLSRVWRAYLEDSKKTDGDVLSYKMLSLVSARDGEPNLLLLVELKNMAAYDRSMDYFDKQAIKIQGTLDKSIEANIDREALRNLRGSILTREIHFTN